MSHLDVDGNQLKVGDLVEVLQNTVIAYKIDSDDILNIGAVVTIYSLGKASGLPRNAANLDVVYYNRKKGSPHFLPCEHVRRTSHIAILMNTLNMQSDKSCSCSVEALMKTGCVCGAVTKYVEPKLD